MNYRIIYLKNIKNGLVKLLKVIVLIIRINLNLKESKACALLKVRLSFSFVDIGSIIYL